MTARAKKQPKPAPPPTPEEEEAAFIESLVRQGKAVPAGCPLPPGATHRLVVTPKGVKRVKRKRFSAGEPRGGSGDAPCARSRSEARCRYASQAERRVAQQPHA